MGDFICDDKTNIPECDFDGGDCCIIDSNHSIDIFCEKCFCEEKCAKPEWINDGVCDDQTNNLQCEFDGGDCCLNPNNDEFCSLCECKEDLGTCKVCQVMKFSLPA